MTVNMEIIVSRWHGVLKNKTMSIRRLLVVLTCSLYCTSAKVNKRFVESIDDNGDISRTKCTGDCLLLYDTIVSKINKTVKPCENMYSFMCNGEEHYEQTEYPNNVLPKIQTHTINILSSPITSSESKFFNIDKELYQQCMKLGSDWQSEDYLAFETLRRQLVKYVKENRKWQDLEIKINSLGFDYTFFDINVIDDPEEPSRRIIILQPPSFKHLKTVTNKMKSIMKYKYYYGKVKYFGEVSAFDDLFDFVNEYLKEPVQIFLDSLYQIETTVLRKYKNAQLLNIKTTVREFNHFFEQLSEINEFAQIDWTTIIQLTFQKVDIQVMDTENIIIKNKPFFIELSKLLNKTPNNVIVSAILAKLITENLAYIDWNLAQSLETVNKQSFCLKETKLYGVSHKIIYKYIADRSDILVLKRVEDIVANIADVFTDEILKTYTLFSREQIYLEHKLKSITDNLLDYMFHSPFNPHADLEMTPSYFFNIIKYREVLKHHELKTLRNPTHFPLPFSIKDVEKARNRFILYVLTNSDVLVSPTLPKGVLYGNYGVKVSGFLYALMNENIFKDGIYQYDIPDWFAYPEYSEDTISCYESIGMIDFNRNQVIYMITETLGLQIAYQAMIKDNYIKSHDPFSINLLLSHKITMDQLFFSTYVKNHCYADSDTVNKIISNTMFFSNTFNCYYNKNLEKCPLQAFGTRFEKTFFSEKLRKF